MKKLIVLAVLTLVISLSAVSAFYSAYPYPTKYTSKVYLGNENYMIEVNPGKSVEVSQMYYPKIIREQTVSMYPPIAPYVFDKNTYMVYTYPSQPTHVNPVSGVKFEENYRIIN